MDESNQTNDKTYSQYTPRDVLCGRGKSLDAHSGNRAFRVMMRDQSEFYENATRQEKGRMLLLLSDEMRAKGVRFLKKDSMGLWQELDADGMKQKVRYLCSSSLKYYSNKVRILVLNLSPSLLIFQHYRLGTQFVMSLDPPEKNLLVQSSRRQWN